MIAEIMGKQLKIYQYNFFRLLSQTTLRNILGTKNLHEILSDRESISSAMQVGIVSFDSLYFWFLTLASVVADNASEHFIKCLS